MKSFNILLTAASRRVPLVRAFQDALRSLGLRGKVLVTDVNPLSPAVHVADHAYQVPLATDPGYIPELLAICQAEAIDLLIPTIDDELAAIGAAVPRFREIGTRAVCSPAETAAACDDKYETCRVLAEHGVRAARTYVPGSLPPDVEPPLFIKPRIGRGAVGAFPIRTRRELEFFLEYVPTPVVQEFLDGPEYTIDVLCDFEGTPLAIVPRERVVIRAGVIDRGRTVLAHTLIDLARAACRAFRFVGPINIQCRMRAGEPAIIEVNPRFSGGIPLTIAAGADFPRLLIELALGRPVQPAIGRFTDGLWMTSFESAIFLEPSRVRLERRSDLRTPAGQVA